MKRQSKAEEALRAQCRMIEGEITGYDRIRTEMEQKISALNEIRLKIETEIARLEKIRREASIRNKP